MNWKNMTKWEGLNMKWIAKYLKNVRLIQVTLFEVWYHTVRGKNSGQLPSNLDVFVFAADQYSS